MKALEMLYRDKKWIEEECDISKITIERVQTMIKDLVEINESIAELEALQQRSCNSCKYRELDRFEKDKATCRNKIALFNHMVNIDFCCNRYEPKETK